MAHGRRSGFAKKIDTVHWTYGSAEFSGLAGSGSIGVNVLAAQHLPETLMRIRGEWIGQLDGVQTPGVAASLSVGLIQVPEGTGTTVLWSPITDGDAPWIWWDTFNLIHEEMVIDVLSTALSGARRVVDSKAMRKLRNTEIQFVAENASLAGTPAVQGFFAGRFLAGS